MPFIPHTPWSGDQLFRPSRPDFIETEYSGLYQDGGSLNCSGLLGRTSLRLQVFAKLFDFIPNCSGLLGRTSLRLAGVFIPEKAAELIVPAF